MNGLIMHKKSSRLRSAIKKLVYLPRQDTIYRKLRKKNAIVLFGSSIYNNLGDHFISHSSVKFIKMTYPGCKVVEIPMEFFKLNKKRLVKYIKKETPIFIVGGGWMGGLWPNDEYAMQDVISSFSSNKIIVLPQTVYYDLNNDEHRQIFNNAIDVYKKCADLRLFFRENNSYSFARKHFNLPNVRTFLAPDMALYLKSIEKRKQKNQILVCMRKDREKANAVDVTSVVNEYCRVNKYSCKNMDTVLNISVPMWLRKTFINNIIRKFSSSKLVITDRLHGMIFAVLSNTKCIVFDNKSKKVSGVYNVWLKNNDNILLMPENVDKKTIAASIDRELFRTDDSKASLSRYFNDMIKEICK